MIFRYGSATVHMETDDGQVQIVCVVSKKDSLHFKTAMHTSDGLQVETFTVDYLRVFIRKGDGVRILQ